MTVMGSTLVSADTMDMNQITVNFHVICIFHYFACHGNHGVCHMHSNYHGCHSSSNQNLSATIMNHNYDNRK